MLKHLGASVAALFAAAALLPAVPADAQQPYPSASQAERPARTRARANDAYRPDPDSAGLGVLNSEGRAEPPVPYGSSQSYGSSQPYSGQSYQQQPYAAAPPYAAPPYGGASAPPAYGAPPSYGAGPQSYGAPPPYQAPYGAGAGRQSQGDDAYRAGPGGYASNQGFGQPYSPPQAYDEAQGRRPYMSGDGPRHATAPGEYQQGNSFSMAEITNAGHGFFGSITQGLASVIEHTHRKKGRPNGYILGEEAGGAFVAGLRYGRGRLYTKDAGVHNIYWQGPSLGFDAGAEGSKVMILVYNLRDINETYERFGGVDGSAYVVGGVGVTFLSRDQVVMAPIRSGVGLRVGANVGYLKFTQQPTWNPF
jgi:hypothetical protein